MPTLLPIALRAGLGLLIPISNLLTTNALPVRVWQCHAPTTESVAFKKQSAISYHNKY
jgi:hypothetical protein